MPNIAQRISMITYPLEWETLNGKQAKAEDLGSGVIRLSVDDDNRKFEFDLKELQEADRLQIGPWIRQAFSEWVEKSGVVLKDKKF